ncbi:MAG: hypothetical protein AABO58_21715 [Acidobacteriota bacterium]
MNEAYPGHSLHRPRRVRELLQAMTQDPATPISANYSKLVLIDAGGGRRDPVFS